MSEKQEYVVVVERAFGLGESILQRTDDAKLAKGYFEGYARTYQGTGQRGVLRLRNETTGEVLEERTMRG
jgi:hypothetical protein